MANSYDWLGDNKNLFMKSSLAVYNNLSGVLQYVGKTENEKTIRMDTEYVEWFDNTSGVQTLYIKDLDKFGFAIDFAFSQVLDSNALAITFNSDWDQSDDAWDYHFFGSNPNVAMEAEWRFVGQSRSGLQVILVIRNGVITLNGEWPVGAPGAFSNEPVTCAALQDTSITNTKRDLAYIMIEKETSGS